MATHAVDLDRTLAKAELGKYTPGVIGEPIPKMVERVKRWLRNGDTVVVLTARLSGGGDHGKDRRAIASWTKEHIGEELRATAEVEPRFDSIWNEKAHAVVANTGEEKSDRRHYTTTAIL